MFDICFDMFFVFIVFLFIDGCYVSKIEVLCDWFFEVVFMCYCVIVEVYWLIVLLCVGFVEVLCFFDVLEQFLLQFVECFIVYDVVCIKEIECVMNYDVKVVEYWLKELVKGQVEFEKVSEFIYFVCMFEDINNMLYGMMFVGVCEYVILLVLCMVYQCFVVFVYVYVEQLMLLCMYGQLVSLMMFGKEFVNVVVCFVCVIMCIEKVEIFGKMNGVVGNFNVYLFVYLEFDWEVFLCDVIENCLKFMFNLYMIQIELYDYMVELFDVVVCVNMILFDFDCDVWGYILVGYFKQKMKVGEIGLLMMLYKVNLIDFENLEGNFGFVNVMLCYFVDKLLVLCWQCDLIDLMVLCNMGVVFGYLLFVYDLLICGFDKFEVNLQCLNEDFDNCWEVFVELVQMVMCCYGIENLYEQLKELMCGKGIMCEVLQEFVGMLVILQDVKECLFVMMLVLYIGKVVEFVKWIV